MREVCPAAVLLAPNNVGTYGSPLWCNMHLIGQSEPIVLNEIGLREGPHKIAYK